MTTPSTNDIEYAKSLIHRFLVAMRYWGAQEDGIPETMAALYCEGKSFCNDEYAADSGILQVAEDYKGVVRF